MELNTIHVFTEKQKLDYLESVLAPDNTEIVIQNTGGNVMIQSSNGVNSVGPTLRDAISNGLRNLNG